METVGKRIIFYFCRHFVILQGDIEPTFTLLSSLKTDVTALQTQRGLGIFGQKLRHLTLLYRGFSGKIGKIEYLRRYFNRITISYKCGTWLIRFVS